jgi:hypothetical protein
MVFMKPLTTLLVAGAVLLAVGCSKKEDPRDRPGFVDTSDPSKVPGTMGPGPKGKSSGAAGSAGAGAPKP